jgi:hypothetical protein
MQNDKRAKKCEERNQEKGLSEKRGIVFILSLLVYFF